MAFGGAGSCKREVNVYTNGLKSHFFMTILCVFYTNNKTINYLSPQIIEHKKDQDVWR
jgi:hypothetical protein